MMNCYYILMHGQLKWHEPPPATVEGDDIFQPQGFYCHRYVLAPTPQAAQATAFEKVRRNLDKEGWLTDNAVTLTLEADEVALAPIYKVLKPDNLGHTFYSEEPTGTPNTGDETTAANGS
jgi:hypothetical protein